MSVSLDHELMVFHLIQWLDEREAPFRPQTLSTECSLYPKIKTAPPIINDHRPDLFAVSKASDPSCLIGEAKTTRDLETYRTEFQLRSFVRYLIEVGHGYLVLGVTWNSVPSARSLLRKIFSDEGATNITPIVVDCSVSLMRSDLR